MWHWYFASELLKESMKMEEDNKAKTSHFEDIIRSRLDNLIRSKAVENDEAVGRLKDLENSWDSLNKSLEEEVKTEIDLTGNESKVMEKTKVLLKEVLPAVASEDIFVITGKVIDKRNKIGVPGLTVKISIAGKKESAVSAEVHTDHYGNFSNTFTSDELSEISGTRKKITFSVYADSGTIIHKQEINYQIATGSIKSIVLKVPASAKIAKLLETGKALHDSVEKDDDLLNERISKMKDVHNSLKGLKKVGLEELRKLKEELSSSPPVAIVPVKRIMEIDEAEIIFSRSFLPGEKCPVSGQYKNIDTGHEVTVVKGEPFPPTPESGQRYVMIDPTRHKRVEPVEVIKTELEDIKGIGLARAKLLKKAGIKDIERFSRAENKDLMKILNIKDADRIKAMKKESVSLLKRIKGFRQ